MIRGIHHVGLHASDLDRLRAFYEEAFGFTMVGEEMRLDGLADAALVTGVRNPAARVVILRAANCFLEIFQWTAPKGGALTPARPYDFGYTHLCVEVADIELEYTRLAELGLSFVHPSAVRFGNIASVYGHDPDGNIIEISEFSEPHALRLHMGGAGQG